jgi:D-alanyl-lipoteichoic acid acyltransferase DltB (MBOAT superfamily)
MSFVQLEFLWLFALTWLAYVWLPRTGQNALLLVSGAVFYGWIHPWFLALVWFSATLDYVCTNGITRYPEHERTFLRLSILGNLGMLGVFKYLGWFVDNVSAALSTVGLGGLPTLELLLPVGISFYTFQTLAYTVDVYRGKTHARTSYLDTLVFVSFFPQLVAGPIERASTLLPQLEERRTVTATDVREGFALALWGGFKKVVVGDTLAPWVDRIFAYEDPSWGMVWAATLAFSVQILADFSGYTDIARGTARMLGIRLSENFRWPYMAATPTEVWNRFHISFTSWLNDYVFYPMAASRWVRKVTLPGLKIGGQGHLFRVTILTFTLSGLWHGAAWHFVLWGFFNGTLAVVYMWTERRLPKAWRKDSRWRWVTVPFFYYWQLFSLLMFRTPTIEQLVQYWLLVPFAGTRAQGIVATGLFGITVALASTLVLRMLTEWYVLPKVRDRPWFDAAQATWWAVLIWAIWLAERPGVTDFIYFQF